MLCPPTVCPTSKRCVITLLPVHTQHYAPLMTAGGKSRKPNEAGMELTDNSLYDGSRKNRYREEFLPDAFEAQYEPPPDEHPKPTHPTGQLDQPPPLYDTLNPSQRQHSTNSIGSGKELPNPLYSGFPSSRPTSQQLQDSGSGTGHSAKGVRGEPLYSEATDNRPIDNGAVYTEPNMDTSRTSQLLDSHPPPPPDPQNIPSDPFSPSPPPAPDPRSIPTISPNAKDDVVFTSSDHTYDPLTSTNIPTYAEAGPGSQEHLYSELPDPGHSGSTHRPPVFHIPPPPLPPTSFERSVEVTPPGTNAPSSQDTL